MLRLKVRVGEEPTAKFYLLQGGDSVLVMCDYDGREGLCVCGITERGVEVYPHLPSNFPVELDERNAAKVI